MTLIPRSEGVYHFPLPITAEAEGRVDRPEVPIFPIGRTRFAKAIIPQRDSRGLCGQPYVHPFFGQPFPVYWT